MITSIDTPEYTLYLTGIDNSQSSSSRYGREQEASANLIHAAFGNKAVKAHYPDGAPFVTGHCEIPISLSHSASTCLLAVSKGGKAIGADIESPRPQLARVSPRFLTGDELSRLAMESDGKASLNFLLKCWTAKEAVYKAARTPGLSLTDISTNTDFSQAEADGRHYDLAYHLADTGETICIAIAPDQLIS